MDDTPLTVSEPLSNKELQKYLRDDTFINSFKEFDPLEQMEPYKNSTVLILASRGKGKTVILKHYLNQVKKWYQNNCQIHCFSETAYLQPGLFSYIVPQLNIYKDFSIESIGSLVDEQEKLVLQYITTNKLQKVDDKCPFLILIFDDFIGQRQLVTSSIFNNIFTNSRHKNIVCICLAQTLASLTGLPRVIKSNADLVILFSIENFIDREIAVESWLSLENKKMGHIILKALTYEQYSTIAICVRNHKQTYQDYIFRYKSPSEKIPDFHIGNPTINPYLNPNILNYNSKNKSEYKFKLEHQDPNIKLTISDEKDKNVGDYFDALSTSRIKDRNKTGTKIKIIKPKKK